MPLKKIVFNAALEPLAAPLPTAIAETIGRCIARHSYLEWLLGQVLYSLLEISIKQGRMVVRRPEPRQYVAAVQGLFAFHKLETLFAFDDFARALDRADRARDALVHSVFMRDSNSRSLKVHLVRGSWALRVDPEDFDIDRRDQWNDAPVLDRALLSRLRDDIEDAVKRAEKLQAHTDKLLRQLHEQRRVNPHMNRRRGER
jgi:hypothetical protein